MFEPISWVACRRSRSRSRKSFLLLTDLTPVHATWGLKNEFVCAKGAVSVKRKGLILTGGVSFLFCLLLTLPAGAEQEKPVERRTGKVTVGVGLGPQGGTADGTAFAIGLSGDYFLTHNTSVGPLLQIGVTEDLAQLGFSVQAKYTMDIRGIPDLKPHVQGGIGFIHAELDRGPFGDVDDTSFLIPLGLGAEYRLSQKISLDSALLFNFTELDDVRDDEFFITWLIGVRFPF